VALAVFVVLASLTNGQNAFDFFRGPGGPTGGKPMQDSLGVVDGLPEHARRTSGGRLVLVDWLWLRSRDRAERLFFQRLAGGVLGDFDGQKYLPKTLLATEPTLGRRLDSFGSGWLREDRRGLFDPQMPTRLHGKRLPAARRKMLRPRLHDRTIGQSHGVYGPTAPTALPPTIAYLLKITRFPR